MERGSVGQLDVDQQEPVILKGEESEGNPRDAVEGQNDDPGEEHEGDGNAADEQVDGSGIGTGQPAENPVECLEERIAGRAVGLEQQGTEGGAQGQGVDRAEEGGDRDGETELAVELADHAAEERRGREDRHQYQRGGDDGRGDLAHRLDGRFLAVQAVFAHVAFDVLDHHDRVIDDDADCQDQSEQREHVDGETEQAHDRECPDDRHRDGEHRDQRGSPILQEQEDDQGDQDECLHEGLDDLMDGGADERGGVVDSSELESGGEHPPHVVQRGRDAVGDLQGVGARRLENNEGRARLAVESGKGVVHLAAEFDAGDILDAGEAAALAGFDDDVEELVGFAESAERVDGELEVLALGGGGLTNLAGGDLDVLLLQSADHVVHGEAAALHLVGVQPHPHAVVLHREDEDVPDPLDPGHAVLDVEVEIVGKEKVVIARVRCIEADYRHKGAGRLLGDDALTLDLDRELGQGGGDAVLDEHGRHVDVCAQLECQVEFILTVAAGPTAHVEHVLDAVDLLLDGRSDGVGNDFGVGSRIESCHLDHRRADIRVLGDGQLEDGHAAGDQDQDGDHRGEDGPVNEEAADHGRNRLTSQVTRTARWRTRTLTRRRLAWGSRFCPAEPAGSR